eukprot:NODE_144_length_17694_cov_0.489741.p6 type:complete len:317 gc:universal NODE_144_length_17694_cov_0.489741:16775-15825(-)
MQKSDEKDNMFILSRITNQGVSAIQRYYLFRLLKTACLLFIVVLQFYIRGTNESYTFKEYPFFLMLGFFTIFDLCISVIGCLAVYLNKYSKLFYKHKVLRDRELIIDSLIPYLSMIWQFHIIKLHDTSARSREHIAMICCVLYISIQCVGILFSLSTFLFRLKNGMSGCTLFFRLLHVKYSIFLFDVAVTLLVANWAIISEDLVEHTLNFIWYMGPFINLTCHSLIDTRFLIIYYTKLKELDPLDIDFNISRCAVSKTTGSRFHILCTFLSLFSVSAMYYCIYDLHAVFIFIACVNVLINYASYPMLFIYKLLLAK